MDAGAAQGFKIDIFVRHRADHVWTGDEHIGDLFSHKDEVSDTGRIDCPTGARPQDHRYLRDDTRSACVAEEYFAIRGQRRNPFLDPGPTRVVHADQRRAVLVGKVHQLSDLRAVGLTQRAAQDGEILSIDIHRPAVDFPPAGHHAIRKRVVLFHPKPLGTVNDIDVRLIEGIFIQ